MPAGPGTRFKGANARSPAASTAVEAAAAVAASAAAEAPPASSSQGRRRQQEYHVRGREADREAGQEAELKVSSDDDDVIMLLHSVRRASEGGGGQQGLPLRRVRQPGFGGRLRGGPAISIKDDDTDGDGGYGPSAVGSKRQRQVWVVPKECDCVFLWNPAAEFCCLTLLLNLFFCLWLWGSHSAINWCMYAPLACLSCMPWPKHISCVCLHAYLPCLPSCML